MIEAADVVDALIDSGIHLYTGVPDSVLGDFSAELSRRPGEVSHITAVNEGAAVAIALGWAMCAAQLPLVYLQNSGLSHALNPLMSLGDPSVYGVPLVLLIGMRGTGTDEPQHTRIGSATLPFLAAAAIPYRWVGGDIRSAVGWAVVEARRAGCAVALLVERNSMRRATTAPSPKIGISRRDAIAQVLQTAAIDDVVVGSTGFNSRELFFQTHEVNGVPKTLLAVGGMGHASSLGLGLSLARDNGRVWVVEGDGGLLMHMGSLVTSFCHARRPLKIIVLNNGAHESVGGQPTDSPSVDLVAFAGAIEGARCFRADSIWELSEAIQAAGAWAGHAFVEVKTGLSPDVALPRPDDGLKVIGQALAQREG